MPNIFDEVVAKQKPPAGMTGSVMPGLSPSEIAIANRPVGPMNPTPLPGTVAPPAATVPVAAPSAKPNIFDEVAAKQSKTAERSKSHLYLGGQGFLGQMQNKFLDYADERDAAAMHEANVNPAGAEQHVGNLYGMLDKAPTTYAHAASDLVGIAGSMAEHPVQTTLSMLPVTRLAMMPVLMKQGWDLASKPRGKDESAPDYIQRLLLGTSMITGAAGTLGEKAPLDLKTLRHAPANVAETMGIIADTFPRGKIVESANQVLQKGQDNIASAFKTSVSNAQSSIGEMVKGINKKDTQLAPQGYLPTGGLTHAITQVADALNVPSTELPETMKTLSLVDDFGKEFGQTLGFDHVKSIRESIGSRMGQATGKDYAAMSSLYKGFESMMKDRAAQIGETPAFNNYVDLSKKLSSARGVLDGITKAATPVDFFKKLSDTKIAPLLRGTKTSPGVLDLLEQHGGLPKNEIENVVQQHAPITTLADIAGRGPLSVSGRLSSIVRHKIMAGSGYVLASKLAGVTPISSFILGLLGTTAGANIADQFGSARAIKGLESAPNINVQASPISGPQMPPIAPQGGISQASPQSPVGGAPFPTPAPTSTPAPTLQPMPQAPGFQQLVPQAATAPTSVPMPVETPAQPQTPVESVSSTPEVVKPTKTPKTKPQTSYEQLGITLNPTEWRTPEDVINAKKNAVQELTGIARKKANEISGQVANGSLTTQASQAALKRLSDQILKASRAIDKVKSEWIGRDARDRLRKGATALPQHDVDVSNSDIEETTRAPQKTGEGVEAAMMKVNSLQNAMRAAGHGNVAKVIEREFKKASKETGFEDHNEHAAMLQEAFDRLMKPPKK